MIHFMMHLIGFAMSCNVLCCKACLDVEVRREREALREMGREIRMR